MGTTLYNRIPLGRSSILSSPRVRAALLAAACLMVVGVCLLLPTGGR